MQLNEKTIRGLTGCKAFAKSFIGQRVLCGVHLLEGMNETTFSGTHHYSPLPAAEQGHDEDISQEEIIRRGPGSKRTRTVSRHMLPALILNAAVRSPAGKTLILADTK